MATLAPKLEWKDEYSVQVEEIDSQHKKLFEILNELINLLSGSPSDEDMNKVIASLVEYKKLHFATEEKYFRQFNYGETEEHIKIHQEFGRKVAEIQEKNKADTLSFAYELVDYLEDWLIGHLMYTDHKYVECFKSHGLK